MSGTGGIDLIAVMIVNSYITAEQIYIIIYPITFITYCLRIISWVSKVLEN